MELDTKWKFNWGFVIIAVAFFINFVSDGMRYAFGLLFTEFLEYYDNGEAETAWVGSLFFSVPYLTAPLAGMFVTKFGCRLATMIGGVLSFVGFLASSFSPNLHFLYFSLGIVTATGFSLTYVSRIVIVLQYFKKKRSLAVGISLCGSGIGGIVLSQITSFSINTYSWRGTFLIVAAIAFNQCVAGTLMRPKRGDKHTAKLPENTSLFLGDSNDNDDHFKTNSIVYKPKYIDAKDNNEELLDIQAEIPLNQHDGVENKTLIKESVKGSEFKERQSLKQIYRNPKIYLAVAAHFFLSLAFSLLFIFIPETTLAKGHSKQQAVWLITSLGISSTVSRVVSGYFGDKSYVNNSYVLITSLFIQGAAATVFAYSINYVLLVIVSAIIGAALGTYVALLPAALTDIFDESTITEVYSTCVFGYGPGLLVGPPFTAWVVAITGIKQSAFVSNGVANSIAGFLMLLCYRISVTERKQHHITTV